MGAERRLRLFINARILVSLLFLVSTVLLKYQNPSVLYERFQPEIIRLMAFSFLFSIGSLLALRFGKYNLFLTYLQIIWDLLFVTVLILFTGGIHSPYSFLYLVSIMVAGMLIGRREALYTASLCGILYGSLLDFQYFGYLSVIGLSQNDAQQLGASQLFYTIFLNLVSFGLTAFITGMLSERARQSEEALQRTSIDYDELAQLNSTIVTHSQTGILTTTISGKIRVFNPYAEEIVGLSQSDVYDRSIERVFPQLSGLLKQPSDSINREFEYIRTDGSPMILGFKAASFNDSIGDPAGFIVNFRDITAIRQMEKALKRADRLAALGELSARMAHEIRNPLAALCGSVQMLAGHGNVADQDRRLLAIVTREAERLNLLITEFLAYARPNNPKREPVTLHALIEETCDLMSSDHNFRLVTIRNLIPSHSEVIADPNQLRQVFINLLHNATDAMPDGGSITIESSPQLRGADGYNKIPFINISVTDSGSGISEEESQHLFEPFWTTKSHGTGLGLAICYRIIEAHGGNLTAESPAEGGCRFVISLPSD
ncbi:MAG: PAS domain S-box protein [Geobacter sp.]|nr:PAS domain S-box protein [Geobacter sp.]